MFCIWWIFTLATTLDNLLLSYEIYIGFPYDFNLSSTYYIEDKQCVTIEEQARSWVYTLSLFQLFYIYGVFLPPALKYIEFKFATVNVANVYNIIGFGL